MEAGGHRSNSGQDAAEHTAVGLFWGWTESAVPPPARGAYPRGRRAPSRRTAPPRAPPRDRVALLGRVSRQRLPSRGRGEGAGRTCGRRAKGRVLSRAAPSQLRFFSSRLWFFSF